MTIAAIFGGRKQPDISRTEEEAMVKEMVGTLAWLRKRIEQADTDLLREMVKAVAERLMSAEVDAKCGAMWWGSSPTGKRSFD